MDKWFLTLSEIWQKWILTSSCCFTTFFYTRPSDPGGPGSKQPTVGLNCLHILWPVKWRYCRPPGSIYFTGLCAYVQNVLRPVTRINSISVSLPNDRPPFSPSSSESRIRCNIDRFPCPASILCRHPHSAETWSKTPIAENQQPFNFQTLVWFLPLKKTLKLSEVFLCGKKHKTNLKFVGTSIAPDFALRTSLKKSLCLSIILFLPTQLCPSSIVQCPASSKKTLHKISNTKYKYWNQIGLIIFLRWFVYLKRDERFRVFSSKTSDEKATLTFLVDNLMVRVIPFELIASLYPPPPTTVGYCTVLVCKHCLEIAAWKNQKTWPKWQSESIH